MKIQITTPVSGAEAIKTELLKEGAEIVEETGSETMRIMVLIVPGSFRVVTSLVQKQTACQGSLEVIDLKNHQKGEDTIDDEISQKTERLGIKYHDPATRPSVPIAPSLQALLIVQETSRGRVVRAAATSVLR
ncbi:hypothetical protein PsorP6_008248 [Peronosclerospora sorghi]|uniref:Uncharacterized protein n=1 Tax=Peronosclerospora sorghi TaxID=230839 RepID=A0ACC0WBG0_9STRA|nr:hypothetical protein PsorP6_008248 [Peronosclerospora sorghi]